MIKSILFDLDGTLADTAPDLSNALNAVRLSYKLPKLPIETIRPTVSQGAGVMIKVGFGIDEDDPEFDVIREKFLIVSSVELLYSEFLTKLIIIVFSSFWITW